MDTTPDFDWSTVSGAASYQFQVDDDPSFDSLEIDITTTSSNYNPPSALPFGAYYWRVRAVNACGSSPWSVTRSYQIVTRTYLPIILKGYQ